MIFTSPFPPISIPKTDLYSLVFNSRFGLKNGSIYNRPALIDAASGKALNILQVKEQVDRLAAGLHQYGLKEHDVVAIYSPNHLEYAYAVFSVARLGATLTPANPSYTPDELQYQLKDSNAVILITVPDLIPNAVKAIENTKVREIFVLGSTGVQNYCPLRSLSVNGSPPDVKINDVDQRDCFICYSSGTTGRAKGVQLTHKNVVSNICQAFEVDKQFMRFAPNSQKGDESGEIKEVWCAVLPLYHCLALILILCTGLYAGITVIILSKYELHSYLKVIEKYRVTWLQLVPPIAISMAKSSDLHKYDLTSVHTINVGAAPLGKEVQQELAEKVKCVVKQGYGMTELSPVSHKNPKELVVGSIGVLVPNEEAKIVDPETGKELGANEEGEIWIRGPNVMKSYLNRPDATAETIDQDGFLHTGDVGYANDKGYFFITDRLKELIKVKGLQVAPAELEALLLSHPSVADAAVIGIADERAGELPKAFVILKPGIPKTEKQKDELFKFIEGKVAPHKRIKVIEFLDSIPKSASGKILRRILRDQSPSVFSKL